jgi:hypothetical protein
VSEWGKARLTCRSVRRTGETVIDHVAARGIEVVHGTAGAALRGDPSNGQSTAMLERP